MTREQLNKLPRPTAQEIIQGTVLSLEVRIECALNTEWWRGYHAAKQELGK